MKIRGIILVSFFLVTLTSCSRSYDYFYISLSENEIPGLIIDEWGKPSLSNLKLSKVIPIRYILKRESYKVRFQISNNSFNPNLIVSVSPFEKTAQWDITFKVNSNAFSPIGIPCDSIGYDTSVPNGTVYTWSAICTAEEYNHLIEFDIQNESGELIASEKIPFRLEQGGTYRLLDGP